jgi:hypothetical protein
MLRSLQCSYLQQYVCCHLLADRQGYGQCCQQVSQPLCRHNQSCRCPARHNHMTQRDSGTGRCIQQTRRRHAAGHQLYCFGAASRYCCYDCCIIQDVPEHSVGSQQGSWASVSQRRAQGYSLLDVGLLALQVSAFWCSCIHAVGAYLRTTRVSPSSLNRSICCSPAAARYRPSAGATNRRGSLRSCGSSRPSGQAQICRGHQGVSVQHHKPQLLCCL